MSSSSSQVNNKVLSLVEKVSNYEALTLLLERYSTLEREINIAAHSFIKDFIDSLELSSYEEIAEFFLSFENGFNHKHEALKLYDSTVNVNGHELIITLYYSHGGTTGESAFNDDDSDNIFPYNDIDIYIVYDEIKELENYQGNTSKLSNIIARIIRQKKLDLTHEIAHYFQIVNNQVSYKEFLVSDRYYNKNFNTVLGLRIKDFLYVNLDREILSRINEAENTYVRKGLPFSLRTKHVKRFFNCLLYTFVKNFHFEEEADEILANRLTFSEFLDIVKNEKPSRFPSICFTLLYVLYCFLPKRSKFYKLAKETWQNPNVEFDPEVIELNRLNIYNFFNDISPELAEKLNDVESTEELENKLFSVTESNLPALQELSKALTINNKS